MTVEQLQDFIADNVHANVPADTVKQMMTDAASMDFGSFVEKWDETLKARSEGWSNLRTEAKSLPERLTAAFGSSDAKNPFVQDANFKDELYEKSFKDVPKEDYDAMIDKMAKYWDDEKRAREYEAGRTRRAKEVKEWGPVKSALASEYEQRRYIEHPERALFGKEAPDFGKAKDTRWGSLADLGLGAAAVGADVGTSFLKTNPVTFGIATLAGPTVRAVRDVSHKAVGSPYQKEWSQIGNDFKSDAAENAMIEGFANLRALSRGASNVGTKNIETALDNAKLIKDTRETLAMLPENFEDLGKMSNSKLYDIIQNMPESEVKKQFQVYAPNPYSVDRAGIADEISRANDLINVHANPATKKDVIKAIDEETEVYPRIGERPYEAKVVFEQPLNKVEKVGKAAIEAASKIPAQATPALKAATEYSKQPVDAREDKLKEWYKQNYKRDWLLEKPFKPAKKEGDPKWEAYVELRRENNLEP